MISVRFIMQHPSRTCVLNDPQVVSFLLGFAFQSLRVTFTTFGTATALLLLVRSRFPRTLNIELNMSLIGCYTPVAHVQQASCKVASSQGKGEVKIEVNFMRSVHLVSMTSVPRIHALMFSFGVYCVCGVILRSMCSGVLVWFVHCIAGNA